jgi:hypothetical protein
MLRCWRQLRAGYVDHAAQVWSPWLAAFGCALPQSAPAAAVRG